MASQKTLVTAKCPWEECGRTAMFPKNFAIYCPVCLKHVLKEHREPPPPTCWQQWGGKYTKAIAEKCDLCLTYLGEKPNPLFQIFYLCIMCGWFYMYIRFGFMSESSIILPLVVRAPPHLFRRSGMRVNRRCGPQEGMSGGLWHMRVIEFGFLIGIGLLIQCYRVDPGKVMPENHAALMGLYPGPGWCRTSTYRSTSR
jgi:hypothetical protein